MTSDQASTFEPKIVGFLCSWCSYAGADNAGTSQIIYPPNLNVVRVMCSGRVDAQHVLRAFSDGADGVIIVACHPGDCHYKEQNFRTAQRYRLLLPFLQQVGIDERRLRLDFVSASEGERFARVIDNMVQIVKALGPLAASKGSG